MADRNQDPRPEPSRHRRRLGWVLAASALLLMAACGDDDSDGPSPEAPATTAADAREPDNPEAPTDPQDGSDTGGDSDAGTLPALPERFQGYQSEQYAGTDNWLCHPDLSSGDNICHRDLDATVVAADGSLTPEPHERANDPAIDCFYVYPTVSLDPTPNSDLEPGEDEEIWAVVNQAARLSAVCEIYAPVYRSRTVTALLQADDDPEVRDTAYGDVLDAFSHYLANHNNGRGVLLIGHSQGAGILNSLVAEEFDGDDALTDRLVAAYLLGATVSVPTGQDVGAAFDAIPLCRSDDQVGCVVSYASYSSVEPPDDDALFGRPRFFGGRETDDTDDLQAACTNPAALAGGPGTLLPYFPADRVEALVPDADLETPWITIEAGLEAECVADDTFSYLEVQVPDPERAEALRGGLPPTWGLHLADVNLTMGNLVELAARQAAAFTG